jgi:hypothetical protein
MHTTEKFENTQKQKNKSNCKHSHPSMYSSQRTFLFVYTYINCNGAEKPAKYLLGPKAALSCAMTLKKTDPSASQSSVTN